MQINARWVMTRSSGGTRVLRWRSGPPGARKMERRSGRRRRARRVRRNAGLIASAQQGAAGEFGEPVVAGFQAAGDRLAVPAAPFSLDPGEIVSGRVAVAPDRRPGPPNAGP